MKFDNESLNSTGVEMTISIHFSFISGMVYLPLVKRLSRQTYNPFFMRIQVA
jgi:hypothetical protein